MYIVRCFQTCAMQNLVVVRMEAVVILTAMVKGGSAVVQTNTAAIAVRKGEVSVLVVSDCVS